MLLQPRNGASIPGRDKILSYSVYMSPVGSAKPLKESVAGVMTLSCPLAFT
jgi:hypothetical protein